MALNPFKSIHLSQRLLFSNGTLLKSFVDKIFSNKQSWSKNLAECGESSVQWMKKTFSMELTTASYCGLPNLIQLHEKTLSTWDSSPAHSKTKENCNTVPMKNRSNVLNYQRNDSDQFLTNDDTYRASLHKYFHSKRLYSPGILKKHFNNFNSSACLQLPVGCNFLIHGKSEYMKTERNYSTDVCSGKRSSGIQKQVSALTAKRPMRRKTQEKTVHVGFTCSCTSVLSSNF